MRKNGTCGLLCSFQRMSRLKIRPLFSKLVSFFFLHKISYFCKFCCMVLIFLPYFWQYLTLHPIIQVVLFPCIYRFGLSHLFSLTRFRPTLPTLPISLFFFIHLMGLQRMVATSQPTISHPLTGIRFSLAAPPV